MLIKMQVNSGDIGELQINVVDSNNVPIKDEKMVDCFRNHFDRTKIKKIKKISKVEAEKKGIPNVPEDGALLVTTKKGYYFDFFCE